MINKINCVTNNEVNKIDKDYFNLLDDVLSVRLKDYMRQQKISINKENMYYVLRGYNSHYDNKIFSKRPITIRFNTDLNELKDSLSKLDVVVDTETKDEKYNLTNINRNFIAVTVLGKDKNFEYECFIPVETFYSLWSIACNKGITLADEIVRNMVVLRENVQATVNLKPSELIEKYSSPDKIADSTNHFN